MIDFVAASSQYVKCAGHASIDGKNNSTISLAGWVNPDLLAVDTPYTFSSKISVANTRGWVFWLINSSSYVNTIRFWNYFSTLQGDWRPAISVIGTGAWYHIAMTYDGSSSANDPIFYVNGVLKATTELTTPNGTPDADTNTEALYFGIQDGASFPYDGQMEDPRYFTRILSQEEISLLAAGYRGPLGGEVLWLSMNEARILATPGTLTQGTHTLSDLSANSNDGDPYGSPVMVASDCPRMGMAV